MKLAEFCSDNLLNPPYPPYHKGRDLEDFFIDYYFKNKEKFDSTGYNFLPIKWTAIYNLNPHLINKLQNEIHKLDKIEKYFTVSQHDDAPFVQLPPITLNFSAGGNQQNTIPIPLICSPIINKKPLKKDIFCSFVGSVNQNIPGNAAIGHHIRMKMLNTLMNKNDYLLKPKYWSPEINTSRQDLFLNITGRSKYTLCPRGYGATSFRMYEAMQLSSIPVYIYNKTPFIPFKDKIQWEDISVLIEASDIEHIDFILKSIDDERYNKMVNNINNVYPKYFTLESMCDNILKILQTK